MTAETNNKLFEIVVDQKKGISLKVIRNLVDKLGMLTEQDKNVVRTDKDVVEQEEV